MAKKFLWSFCPKNTLNGIICTKNNFLLCVVYVKHFQLVT